MIGKGNFIEKMTIHCSKDHLTGIVIDTTSGKSIECIAKSFDKKKDETFK